MTGLALRCWGPQGGSPIVFLHGFLGTSREWMEVSELLPETRGFAVDLPGHGSSIDMPSAAYTLEGAAEAVMQTLLKAGIGRCFLVGYSMGGRVAMHLALRYPDQFFHVILESAHPGLWDPSERANRRKIDDERATDLVTDFRGFLEEWYRHPLFRSIRPIGETLIERRLRGRPKELARALRGLSTGNQHSLRERLRASPVSITLVAGALDERYSSIAMDLGGETSPLTFCIVPEAGHNVHLEQPRVFADVVRAHITS